MKQKKAKLLGGAPPRRGRWRARSRVDAAGQPSGLVPLAAFTLFVLAVVAGFAYGLDRQLRGGVLAQRAEAIQRPDWVSLRELPPHVPLAFLVAVDPNFLHRHPIDAGVEGTTLSRDLVRQVHRIRNSVPGDARGILMGTLLEARLTDAELLELYLNRVQLGQDAGWSVQGVYHASREYFGKEPAELTLGEAATLAGFVLPPPLRDPRRQVGAVGIRRNEVLGEMLRTGVIGRAEQAAAIEEPLGIQYGPEHAPMTRPAGWERRPDVIRLPSELLQPQDTLP
jgi:membrane peptidoglycan carboxypeptidase